MDTKSIFDIVCFSVSVALFVCAIITYFIISKKSDKEKHLLTAFHVTTIIGFFCVIFAILPIYFEGWKTILSNVLASLYYSIKTFLGDGDIEAFRANIRTNDSFHKIFYCWFLFLSVAAPLVTFTNILSLFKGLISEIRFRRCKKKNIYIMSELNEASIELAKDIYYNKRDIRVVSGKTGKIKTYKRKAQIVFADFFTKNEENNYELYLEAQNINAIFFKKDISHIDFLGKKQNVELFLIGMNESENLSQASEITDKINEINKKHNIKIFVFAAGEHSGAIIDSLRYDNLLEHAFKHRYDDSTFKLRRVDIIRQLVWNEVTKMPLVDIITKNRKINDISILIVGAGMYGTEFMKVLCWYTQFYGKTTYITVIDNRTGIEEELKSKYPELFKPNICSPPTEAHYDIYVRDGIDISKNPDFLAEMEEGKTKLAKRIKDCDLAIVSLGEDDTNIAFSMFLRSIFDKYSEKKAKYIEGTWYEATKTPPQESDSSSKPVVEKESPYIYSIVYDKQKSGILSDKTHKNNFLITHKEEPYFINFIGALTNQYKYENVYDRYYEIRANRKHKNWIYNASLKDNSKENENNYQRFEYFRLSSISRKLYEDNFKDFINGSFKCRDEKDLKELGFTEGKDISFEEKEKISEHMRWNAYVRALGFTYNSHRDDRAKLHNDLIPWRTLNEKEQEKDG